MQGLQAAPAAVRILRPARRLQNLRYKPVSIHPFSFCGNKKGNPFRLFWSRLTTPAASAAGGSPGRSACRRMPGRCLVKVIFFIYVPFPDQSFCASSRIHLAQVFKAYSNGRASWRNQGGRVIRERCWPPGNTACLPLSIMKSIRAYFLRRSARNTFRKWAAFPWVLSSGRSAGRFQWCFLPGICSYNHKSRRGAILITGSAFPSMTAQENSRPFYILLNYRFLIIFEGFLQGGLVFPFLMHDAYAHAGTAPCRP